VVQIVNGGFHDFRMGDRRLKLSDEELRIGKTRVPEIPGTYLHGPEGNGEQKEKLRDLDTTTQRR